MGEQQTPVLNRIKVILGELNPATRGAFRELTKDTVAELKKLRGDLEGECIDRLGIELPKVEAAILPESAHADYAKAAADVDVVLAAGDGAAADSTAETQVSTAQPVAAAPAEPAAAAK